jgi:hypothetical protein
VLPVDMAGNQDRATITRTTPVPLSTVFVDASAYTRDPERYYSHILRPDHLAVLATEPVLQGRAIRNYTQFILVPTPESDLPLESESATLGSETNSESNPSELDPESESDALEIDEDFLRGWYPASRAPLPLTPKATGESDEQSVCVSTVDLARLGMLSGHWVRVFPCCTKDSSDFGLGYSQAVISPGEAHPDRARLVQVHAQDHIPSSTCVPSYSLHRI